MDYYVKKDGETVIPVEDGVFTTDVMTSKRYGSGYFVISFLDSNREPVTPTAGTIKPEGYLMDGVLGEPGTGATTINATDVLAPDDGPISYEIPTFDGPMVQGQITLSGIAGASFFTAVFNRM